MNFIYAHGPRKKTPTKQGNFPTGSENFRAWGTTEETKRNLSVRQGMWLVTASSRSYLVLHWALGRVVRIAPLLDVYHDGVQARRPQEVG